MIFDALSNAAYRVSLHGPGAELEEGVQTPRPGAFGAEDRPGIGRLTMTRSKLLADRMPVVRLKPYIVLRLTRGPSPVLPSLPAAGAGRFSNDIAVLLLRTGLRGGIVFGDYVRPACLPPQDFSAELTACLVSGWGE